MKSVVRSSAAVAAALVVAGVAFALPRGQAAPAPAGQEKKAEAPITAAPKAEAAKVVIPFFGNETCPTTGKPINKTKYVESDSQRAYYCCGNCQTKAKADPKAALAAAYKDLKAADNKTCPISGEKLEKEKAKEVTFESRKVLLCCADCEKEFLANPYLYTTLAVYAAEDMKNENCPVMAVKEGKEEEAEAEHLAIYDGKVIRFCCDDCPTDFAKEPAKYMAKVVKGK